MPSAETPGTILTEGPRTLPANGWVGVWIDTGAGPGYTRRVPTSWLTLRQVVDSPDYPLPAGSSPDRLVRQLADLAPGWPAELSTPDTDSSARDI